MILAADRSLSMWAVAHRRPIDGYLEDEEGWSDRGMPDEVHAFVNDLERPIGTYLYGRRMYETRR